MKILVLTKRQYHDGNDFLTERFGRLYEIPRELARRGHEVTGICLSYRELPEGIVPGTEETKGLHPVWHSVNAGGFRPWGLVRFYRKALETARTIQPDVILSFSDSLYVLIGGWIAAKTGAKHVPDLYDAFESFRSGKLPGVIPLFKNSVRRAAGVSVVSAFLRDRVLREYPPRGPVRILPNGVRTDLFYLMDKADCRQRLGLPSDARILACAGALNRDRGIQTVFDAFFLLKQKFPDLILLLAGPKDRHTMIPEHPDVRYLGQLPLAETPVVVNAADVLVVCVKNSLFGQGSFPQKVHELIACRAVFVAGSIDALKNLLKNYPQCLFEPENPESLCRAAEHQLNSGIVFDLDAPGWPDIAKDFEKFLTEVTGPSAFR